MSRRRNAIAVLIGAVMVALLAAGCGGGDDGDGAGGSEDVSGSVSVMAVWTGAEQEAFQAVLAGFEEQFPNVTTNYTSAGDQLPTQLSTAVEGGNPPDVAVLPQPGLIRDFVRRNALKSLDFARDDVEQNLGESAVQLGSVDDTLYGFLFKAANKSTVWYNVQAFEDAGVEPPATWDEMLQAAETLKASGIPAYSLGGAEGWTLTDLFENIYLRTAGPEMYDQLSTHEIPWTDQSVKDALAEMAKIFSDTDNIVGGTEAALQSDFATSVSNVFVQEPKAAMVIEGDFVPGTVDHSLEPETGFNVFPFPAIEDSPPSVVGGGDMAVMFEDTPAAQAFIEYLASPEAAEIWAGQGGFSSANRNVDPNAYPDPITQETATAIAEADVFRFDLSDLQPSEFGATEGQGLWKLFQDFVQNPDDVDGIAQQMERAASQAYGGG